MSDSDVPGAGAFTPAGSAWVVGADDQAVSMSPIHHWIFAGSRPTKRRKWRYQMEPPAVELYMPMRLPARSARGGVGPSRPAERARGGEVGSGDTGGAAEPRIPPSMGETDCAIGT